MRRAPPLERLCARLSPTPDPRPSPARPSRCPDAESRCWTSLFPVSKQNSPSAASEAASPLLLEQTWALSKKPATLRSPNPSPDPFWIPLPGVRDRKRSAGAGSQQSVLSRPTPPRRSYLQRGLSLSDECRKLKSLSVSCYPDDLG